MSGRLITVPSLKRRRNKKQQQQHAAAPLATHDEFELSEASDTEDASDQEHSAAGSCAGGGNTSTASHSYAGASCASTISRDLESESHLERKSMSDENEPTAAESADADPAHPTSDQTRKADVDILITAPPDDSSDQPDHYVNPTGADSQEYSAEPAQPEQYDDYDAQQHYAVGEDGQEYSDESGQYPGVTVDDNATADYQHQDTATTVEEEATLQEEYSAEYSATVQYDQATDYSQEEYAQTTDGTQQQSKYTEQQQQQQQWESEQQSYDDQDYQADYSTETSATHDPSAYYSNTGESENVDQYYTGDQYAAAQEEQPDTSQYYDQQQQDTSQYYDQQQQDYYYDESQQGYYDTNADYYGATGEQQDYDTTQYDYGSESYQTNTSGAPARPPLPDQSRPARPPPPTKVPTPARPPPPKVPGAKKTQPAVPPPIPRPPEVDKRRKEIIRPEKMMKEMPGKDPKPQDTLFPFKTHFEKKPLVPNPKKAILNVLKGESKKKRRRRKEEEQFDRIINAADSDEDPVDENSEAWKNFKALQERIDLNLSTSQNKIQSLKASLPPEPTEPVLPPLPSKEAEKPVVEKNWATFEFEEEIVDFSTPKKAQDGEPVEDLLGLSSEADAFNDISNRLSSNGTVVDNTFEQVDNSFIFSMEETQSDAVAPLEDDIDSFLGIQKTEEKTEHINIEQKHEFNDEDIKHTEKSETVNEHAGENVAMDFDCFSTDVSVKFATEDAKVVESSDNFNSLEQPPQQSTFAGDFDFDNDASLFNDTDDFITKRMKVEESNVQDAFGKNDIFDDSAAPFSDTNPFNADTFTVSKASTALFLESKRKSSIGIEITPRPRPKPQRQDTLSGNNPFRRGSSQAETAYEEEAAKEEPTITIIKAVATDIVVDVEKKDGKTFDPLKTIYPDSDNESSEDEMVPFKIKIKSKTNILDKPKESGPVPFIPAPPVVDVPRFNPFAEQRVDEKEIDDILPVFQDQPDEWGEKPKAVDFDAAFDVDWSESAATTATTLNRSPSPEVEPFEPFCPVNENAEWNLMLRGPEKKKVSQMSKFTTDRWWKQVYIRLETEKDRPAIKLYENQGDSQPTRVVRLEPFMQLSRDKLQHYDKYGKLHIFKVNHIQYKEMVGMRTEKFSLKTLQNLVSHKPKTNVVLDHMPMRTEILKFGSFDQRLVRSLMSAIEDSLMKIKSHQDTTLEYTKEEVCCYVQDEYEATLDESATLLHHKARSRVFCAAFVTGKPYIVLGINDKWRFGKEVVHRKDIIPIMHDDWINIYNPEFHWCINMDEYDKDHMIKFYPLDGCKFELMRFRVSLRENRELPLICNCKFKIDNQRISIRCDLLIPGYFSSSKRHGSVACEDIEIRIPIPEEWIYHFRVEKRSNKYSSVHSTLRKPGKIKGLERITQLAQSFLPPSILAADAGVAKYEHLYKAIVWRIPRLPEKNEGVYKPHLLTCNLTLGPHDLVPEWSDLDHNLYIEFTMPGSTVSGCTVRSISIEHTSTPERFVKYLAKYVYYAKIQYELGKRKPGGIKSILDEPAVADEAADSSADEQQADVNMEESPEENSESQHAYSVGPIETDDLLGLGGDFGCPAPAAPTASAQHVSNATLLGDLMFGTGGSCLTTDHSEIPMADNNDEE